MSLWVEFSRVPEPYFCFSPSFWRIYPILKKFSVRDHNFYSVCSVLSDYSPNICFQTGRFYDSICIIYLSLSLKMLHIFKILSLYLLIHILSLFFFLSFFFFLIRFLSFFLSLSFSFSFTHTV